MKKSILHIFVWIVLLAVLAGCSFTDAPSTVPTTVTNPTTTARPTTQPTVTPTTTQPTVPTTAPTTAPTTVPTEPAKPAFPEELKNNVYLNWMNSGFCETMTGKLMVTVVFLSDSVSAWSADEVTAMKATLDADLPKLASEATGYGAQLELKVNYLESKIGIAYDQYDPNLLWARSALMSHGLAQAYTNATFLENYYQVDSAPVVFILNREGRAYATTTSGGSQFEYVVMYSSEPKAIRHELCHVFGAIDFYLPDETQAAAEQLLPESIMLDSRTGVVDELTAYLIGWTDVLGPKAEAFLYATNHITEEYLMESIQGDMMTGYGTKRFDDCTYTGDMVRGVPHGEGTCVWDNGITYTGGWDNGQMSGYGEISKPDGYSYKGQWKDGQYSGTGTLVYSGGKESYTGEFRSGLRHGKGTHVYSNGDTYTGDWVDGKIEGQGKFIWKSGEVYEGTWVNGRRQGQGTMTWTDGSYYTGTWVSNRRSGTGVLYYGSTGDRYEGEFKNDKRHGSGTFYKADGTVTKGTWENDKLVQEEPSEPSEEPES